MGEGEVGSRDGVRPESVSAVTSVRPFSARRVAAATSYDCCSPSSPFFANTMPVLCHGEGQMMSIGEVRPRQMIVMVKPRS